MITLVTASELDELDINGKYNSQVVDLTCMY